MSTLENELRNIQHDSIFAEVIRQNPIEALPMIQAQIKDARLVVVGIIGEHLVAVIENLDTN